MTSNAIEVIPSNQETMTTPEPGLRRQVMSYSPAMMLVRHTMKKGWAGTPTATRTSKWSTSCAAISGSNTPGGVFEVGQATAF